MSCANNPLKFVDPDGRELRLAGVSNQKALNQIQAGAGGGITVSMNSNGIVSYSSSTSNISGNAKKIANIIDDNSISVNINTTDSKFTSTGNLMVGGAFMGNEVTAGKRGFVSVIATQEVNPDVLGNADSFTETPGKMMMHEVTEAYEGAKISQEAGVGTPAAINGNSSVYNNAHQKATPQSIVYETMYDKNGNITSNIKEANRCVWSVKSPNGEKAIQTLDKNDFK